MTPDGGAQPTTSPVVTTDENEITPSNSETTTIEDEETAKASANGGTKDKKTSDETTILDNDVPLSDSAPDTGDHVNVLYPLICLVVSAGLIVFIMIRRRKSEE